jgi:hypothetical protein
MCDVSCVWHAARSLPELAALKQRLIETGQFKSVFMTGSGSTMVGFGSDAVPAFLKTEPQYKVGAEGGEVQHALHTCAGMVGRHAQFQAWTLGATCSSKDGGRARLNKREEREDRGRAARGDPFPLAPAQQHARSLVRDHDMTMAWRNPAATDSTRPATRVTGIHLQAPNDLTPRLLVSMRVTLMCMCVCVQDLFISPCRLITRQPNGWYAPSGLWHATPTA